MTDRPRLIAIGLDATPWTLIERWAAAGELPVIGRLMREGATARLDTLGFDLAESTWPTIARGSGAGAHGMYNWRGPDPGSYGRFRRPATLDRAPFWTRLREDAAPSSGPVRTLLLDVPFAPLERADGAVQVAGWGERGGFTNASHPPAELDELFERFGRYPTTLNREAAGRPLLARAQLRTLRRMTPTRTKVLLDLMSRHPWDLVVAAYHETHYAGHAFHVYADPEPYRRVGIRPRLVGNLEHALLRCYQDVDRALGELIAAAPAGTHIAAFSNMGLRASTSAVELVEWSLVALGYQVPAAEPTTARGRQLARTIALTAIPRPLARQIKRRLLDADAIDARVERATYDATDWAATRAWGEGEPGFGFVRLNVRGRDELGVVDPDDAEALRTEIASELLELRIEGSGEPAIDAVVPIEELVGPNPHPALPDLIVRPSPTAMARKVRHPRVGTIGGGRDEFRATEHDGDGWLVMHGPNVAPGSETTEARAEDVAPTLVQLMGGAVPDDYEGRVLDELLAPRVVRS